MLRTSSIDEILSLISLPNFPNVASKANLTKAAIISSDYLKLWNAEEKEKTESDVYVFTQQTQISLPLMGSSRGIKVTSGAKSSYKPERKIFELGN